MAPSQEEIGGLKQLYEQGLQNGVPLELISREEAEMLDPSIKGVGDKVIHSPTTSVMDIGKAMEKVHSTLPKNVTICKQSRFVEKSGEKGVNSVYKIRREGREEFEVESKFLVNVAGQDSLRIAH